MPNDWEREHLQSIVTYCNQVLKFMEPRIGVEHNYQNSLLTIRKMAENGLSTQEKVLAIENQKGQTNA